MMNLRLTFRDYTDYYHLEFVAAFYIEDVVVGERKAFEGNYTLTIVAGGVGYLENIVPYSDSEKEQYNYKPGDK